MTANAPYDDADLSVLDDMPEPRRPWQLEMSSDVDCFPTDKRIDRILTRLFEYRPCLSSKTIQIGGTEVLVRRVFHSDRSDAVDARVVAFFELSPEATGLVFRDGETDHTATPSAPYASPLGEKVATIRRALESGEVSAEEARSRLAALRETTSRTG